MLKLMSGREWAFGDSYVDKRAMGFHLDCQPQAKDGNGTALDNISSQNSTFLFSRFAPQCFGSLNVTTSNIKKDLHAFSLCQIVGFL
jgi:hypothetical protein